MNSPHAQAPAPAYPATQAIRGGEASDRAAWFPPPDGHEVIRIGEEGNALHLRLDFMPAPSDGRAETRNTGHWEMAPEKKMES